MLKKTFLFSILLIVIICESCSNPLDVSIEKSTYKLHEIRIDQLMSQSNLSATYSIFSDNYSKIPEIIEYQSYYCFKTGMPSDEGFDSSWNSLQQNPYFQRLSKAIQKQFPSLDKHTNSIENGFKHLNVHLPKAKLPTNIVYMNTYFASSVYCTENDVAIGLERYLGPKNRVIQELPEETFYTWIKQAMDERYLDRDAVCAWVMTHLIEPKKDANNIEAFIQWGKILYLTKAAFPEVADATILRYSGSKYNWAVRNERMVWEYLVKENLLFRNKEVEQANFLQEAPFTAGLPQNSPDRMGQFMGFRIVSSYMKQYELTLQELIEMPYNELLSEYEIND